MTGKSLSLERDLQCGMERYEAPKGNARTRDMQVVNALTQQEMTPKPMCSEGIIEASKVPSLFGNRRTYLVLIIHLIALTTLV
jgi:hypothetical protein